MSTAHLAPGHTGGRTANICPASQPLMAGPISPPARLENCGAMFVCSGCWDVEPGPGPLGSLLISQDLLPGWEEGPAQIPESPGACLGAGARLEQLLVLHSPSPSPAPLPPPFPVCRLQGKY